jgi:hypothetical protein
VLSAKVVVQHGVSAELPTMTSVIVGRRSPMGVAAAWDCCRRHHFRALRGDGRACVRAPFGTSESRRPFDVDLREGLLTDFGSDLACSNGHSELLVGRQCLLKKVASCFAVSGRTPHQKNSSMIGLRVRAPRRGGYPIVRFR